ncbi:nuclear transport factor 2 family protein [Elongatibacter sediminis]|uniref:Nuclear transport factor 2 family protein n=1 Tax=Elongatibacter sediminis TaxID=3119006 RepID=A0AAW9RJV2_9GAMM
MKLFRSVLRTALPFALPVMLAACAPPPPAGQEKLEVAEAMVQAWNDQDWERVYALFAEDGVLHSVMLEPIVGRAAIRERLGQLAPGIEAIELQIRNQGVVGDAVVLERTDDFVYNGKHSRVPVVGVLEIENGLVTEWREYYDHASLVEALTPEPPTAEEREARDTAEILRLTVKLQEDWNGGDMAGYLAAYREGTDTSLLFGGQALRSWQEIHDLFTSSWTTEEAMGDFATGTVAVRFAGPDVAIASGDFQHVFPDQTIDGGFSHVWHRGPDGWKIVHEHTSRKH